LKTGKSDESGSGKIQRRPGARERANEPCPGQALRLKSLAEEAYQPEQYANDLTLDEAARRIDALKAEIELADQF